jgi:hypothetical protein
MAFLAALEALLGGFEEWPSKILLLLFIEAPIYRNIRMVAAFFYGNGVSCAMCIIHD